MATRLDLDEQLKQIVPNVYYQPPTSVKMKYPCIRYEKARNMCEFANGNRYIKNSRYTLTVIDTTPESIYPEMLEQLEYCTNDNIYCRDGLYHYVYTIII